MPERSNGLRLIVLEDGERALIEVCHQVVLVICHGGLQHYFFDFFFEDEDSVIGLSLILRLLRVVWLALAVLTRSFLIRTGGRPSWRG